MCYCCCCSWIHTSREQIVVACKRENVYTQRGYIDRVFAIYIILYIHHQQQISTTATTPTSISIRFVVSMQKSERLPLKKFGSQQANEREKRKKKLHRCENTRLMWVFAARQHRVHKKDKKSRAFHHIFFPFLSFLVFRCDFSCNSE